MIVFFHFLSFFYILKVMGEVLLGLKGSLLHGCKVEINCTHPYNGQVGVSVLLSFAIISTIIPSVSSSSHYCTNTQPLLS